MQVAERTNTAEFRSRGRGNPPREKPRRTGRADRHLNRAGVAEKRQIKGRESCVDLSLRLDKLAAIAS